MRDTQDEVFRWAGALREDFARVDWAATPLGPVNTWPQSLRTSLSICLAGALPTVIVWGPDLTLLYNEAYAALIGDRHPAALGGSQPVVLKETWPVAGPVIRQVLRTGAGTTYADVLVPWRRHGSWEDCYWTYARSPLRDESGGVVGVLSVVQDTTDRVLAEQALREQTTRLDLLQRLTQRLAAAQRPEEVADVLVAEAVPLLGALAANVVRIIGDEVERISASPLPGAIDQIFRRPLDAAIPACEAARTGTRIVLPTHADRQGRCAEDFVAAFAGHGAVVALPMHAESEVIGSLALSFPVGRTLSEADLELLATLADQCGQALERCRLLAAERAAAAMEHQLLTELRRGHARLAALQRVSAELAAATTSDVVAQVIVRDGLGALADSGGAVTLGPDVGLRVRATLGLPPGALERFASVRPDADLAISRVALLGETVIAQTTAESHAIFSFTADLHTALGTGSLIAVPALVDGTPVGALVAGFTAEGAIDEEVVGFVTALADLMAQAMQRAELYERSVHAAEVLQRSLLPTLPVIDGVEVAALYAPADAGAYVGGDWYDVIDLGSGAVGLVIGDVVGHDIRAAAVMGQLQGAVRCYAELGLAPSAILRHLDRLVDELGDIPMATCLYAVYEPDLQRLTVANAGHIPPLTAVGGRATYLPVPPSPPLGLGRPHPDTVVHLVPGSLLALLTDGLVEVRRESIDVGLGRVALFVAANADLPLPELARRTSAHMKACAAAEDDTALLLLRAGARGGTDAELGAAGGNEDDRPRSLAVRPG